MREQHHENMRTNRINEMLQRETGVNAVPSTGNDEAQTERVDYDDNASQTEPVIDITEDREFMQVDAGGSVGQVGAHAPSATASDYSQAIVMNTE